MILCLRSEHVSWLWGCEKRIWTRILEAVDTENTIQSFSKIQISGSISDLLDQFQDVQQDLSLKKHCCVSALHCYDTEYFLAFKNLVPYAANTSIYNAFYNKAGYLLFFIVGYSCKLRKNDYTEAKENNQSWTQDLNGNVVEENALEMCSSLSAVRRMQRKRTRRWC